MAIRQRRRSGNRGQAVVELALSTLLFVVVIVGGIYFGEIGMLSVKVTEATAAAVWDATGRPAHHYADDGRLVGRLDEVAEETEALIQNQYRFYDGRDLGQGAPPSYVLTTAEQMVVECDEFDASVLGSTAQLQFHSGVEGAGVFSDRSHGGVNCRSKGVASLLPGRAPVHFHEDTGWLSGPLLREADLPLCGLGRAWGGDCNSIGVPILLGEWALSNKTQGEHNECAIDDGSSCGNPGYYGAVNRLYERVGAGSQVPWGSMFVAGMLMINPIGFGGELDFFLSFRGEENSFSESLSNTMGREEFTTTPGGHMYESSIDMYEKAHQARVDAGRCWLGMGCEEY